MSIHVRILQSSLRPTSFGYENARRTYEAVVVVRPRLLPHSTGIAGNFPAGKVTSFIKQGILIVLDFRPELDSNGLRGRR